MQPHAQALVATATFTVDTWDQVESHEHGTASVGHARLAKTFAGDLEGSSRVEMLAVTAADETSRAYVAMEEFDVAVHGKAGTFVVVHHGVQGGGADAAGWTVAPGSGSGELDGIAGTATLDRGDDGTHTFTLEYTLGAEQ
ncbi:MAG: hypothetical protein JWL76_1289 [Thermoleophilia bacterium]|nr:hypothetical protein [Thermoleophilia bacterium]